MILSRSQLHDICATETIFEKSHRNFFPWEKSPAGKNSHLAKWEKFPMGKISHGKKILKYMYNFTIMV